MNFEQRHQLEGLPFAHGKVKVIDEKENDVIVDDASTAIPALMEWCQANNLTVETIEKKLTSFDDVFVKLIEREAVNV
jgi:ABC-type multidrug transport system ATPase subunit